MIEAIKLSKTYNLGETRVHALKEVNHSIARSEFVAITGHSGSGKSTLLHLLGCIEQPTTGSVVIDGQDTGKMSQRALTKLRLRKIGFVFQHFYLLPTLTAQENIELPMKEAGLRRNMRKDRVSGLLAAVGLADRGRHRPNQLSGGEQQRVAIARALANDPPIILADEPTGELDTRTGEGVVDLLAEINREYGKTIVVVSHDPGVAHRAERIIELMDGKTVDAFY
ncbi:MAG: macrolide ABC transporter ATP-binding protein [Desulfuromonadales bacterium C00003096]|nr:MAG: macrolide ABC transporter ATP-binding protein [Desulfuromonadales bacterium C00003096]